MTPAQSTFRKLVTQARLMELADMARPGVAEGALFELPCAEMVRLLDHIDILGAALDVEAGDYCRICGCTEHTPCDPPCAWADEGICTACAEKAHEEELKRLGPCPACDGEADGEAGEPWCTKCDGTGLAPVPAEREGPVPAAEADTVRRLDPSERVLVAKLATELAALTDRLTALGADTDGLTPLLDAPVWDLRGSLSSRARKALFFALHDAQGAVAPEHARCLTLGAVPLWLREVDVLRQRNVGRVTIDEINALLQRLGLRWKS